MVTLSSRSRRTELVEAMLGLVADRGLDALSVREVARASEVSIGTVQHYFATKDAMLAAAFAAVVERVRARIDGVTLGDDVGRNLSLVLAELLPLDATRAAEARVQLAFSARAAVSPELAAMQRALLDEVVAELAGVFRAMGHDDLGARTAARLALAATDGLAQHAVSTDDLDADQQTEALELMLDRLRPRT